MQRLLRHVPVMQRLLRLVNMQRLIRTKNKKSGPPAVTCVKTKSSL